VKVVDKIIRQVKKIKAGDTFKYQQLEIVSNEYQAAAKVLERLVKKGIIKRVSTGVFYKPKQTEFGELKPRQGEIIKQYLFDKNNKRIAYITGTALYNKMGLTSQVPKVYKIASRNKRISINNNLLKAQPIKSYIDVNNTNYTLLEILDALKDFNLIPDLDEKSGIITLKNCLKVLSDNELKNIINYSLKYPPRTRAFLGALIEDLRLQVSTNELKESLNPLTQYNIKITPNLVPSAPNWNIK
jgi:predicted transcriptional regulator of viral defense system